MDAIFVWNKYSLYVSLFTLYIYSFFFYSRSSLTESSLAPSTRTKYKSLWGGFLSLCTASRINPLPVRPSDLFVILESYASTSKSPSMVQSMASAVSFFHRLHGFSNPATDPRVPLLLKGVRRLHGAAPKKAAPMTPAILHALIYHLIGSDLTIASHYDAPLLAWRTVAQALFSFASLARFNCMAKLSLSHLYFHPDHIIVTFPSSKTDQFGTGATLRISASTSAASITCPVKFMGAYYHRLQWESSLSHGRPYCGPLFPALCSRVVLRGADSFTVSLPSQLKPCSYQGATLALRSHLAAVGVEDSESYSLHSGRRGGATVASINGCDFLTLKRHGRWKSDTSPQGYVDEAACLTSSFVTHLGL